ncbi:phosphoribosyltransferase (plasmid) [Legionella adelaidensis]|uniref:Phosphoribosyltransferase n=1 Tax=Legionella adelaidensis TaxID=45056 RepID=A0A0W0R1B5_9GAMM|nr:phosphoribosyltransferase [Legionella adelaidensis]KTC64879.1 phosphoribosyltransferase [Legionella adelaidensis]VEH82950.1 phosphoribosyltransferase [Legionella adelaidensis]
MEKYIDRQEAGEILAKELIGYKKVKDTIIYALPRGGVPVAYQVAKKLDLPLDVFIVRKLGVPGHEELAFGAIAGENTVLYNERIIRDLSIPKEVVEKIIAKEKKELERRELNYRGNIPHPDIENKTIILIDDGIATGATIRVAIKALREQNPREIILAAPVASLATIKEMAVEVDKIYCPLQPVQFFAVGLWYEDFSQTTDEEVRELLKLSKKM